MQTKKTIFASDVGGTFTDLVATEVGPNNEVLLRIGKTATTPPDFQRGVIDGLDQMQISPEDVASHVHGTTVVINALTERNGAKVGLIATEGFRDTLEIARGNRPDFFNLDYHKPEPLVPRYLRREIPGRLTYTGEERAPLQLEVLDVILADFRREHVEAIAVCLMHSWANPDHERQVRDAIATSWPEVAVVASSDITREWREYERSSTAVLSAFVQPTVSRYLRQLDDELSGRGLATPTLVMQSNCGVASIDEVAAAPITMIESGPASGIRGAALLGSMIGEPNVIALDIGGTTAKCSLIKDGEVKIVTDYWIERTRESAGYPALVPVVDLVEIGSGGGSIAAVDDFGRLTVGPQSAGALPGPASYGLGGTNATTTDANLWLGRISHADFCGGAFEPDLGAAEAALRTVGDRLGTDVPGAARAVIRIANNNMINALKLVSVNRGHDPRDFTMVAFGGGGPMHAVALARELGIRRVVVPSTASVFSAWGMITSDLRRDYFATVLADLNVDALPRVHEDVKAMEAQATEDFESAGHPEPTFHWHGRFRYQGQEHASEVPFVVEELGADNLALLVERFGQQYQAEYTYRLDAPVEFVGLHLVATASRGVDLPEPQLDFEYRPAHVASERTIDFDQEGIHTAAVYELSELAAGMIFAGPAVAEGNGTSIVIGPNATAAVDGLGNIIINLLEDPTS